VVTNQKIRKLTYPHLFEVANELFFFRGDRYVVELPLFGG